MHNPKPRNIGSPWRAIKTALYTYIEIEHHCGNNQEMSPPPFQTRESPDTYFENGADKTGTSGHRIMSYLEIT